MVGETPEIIKGHEMKIKYKYIKFPNFQNSLIWPHPNKLSTWKMLKNEMILEKHYKTNSTMTRRA